MKKYFTFFIAFTLSIAAHTQVVIGFGPPLSAEEPTQKLWPELIKRSYNLDFFRYVGDTIPDTLLIRAVIYTQSDNNNYCVLYKDDPRKLGIEITKLQEQKGYIITTYRVKGNIKRISGYDNNLLPSGKWVEYYGNNRVKEIGEYKNGKKIKKWKYYDIDGNTTHTEKYEKNGVVVSKHGNLKG
jgi:hypothetical protein